MWDEWPWKMLSSKWIHLLKLYVKQYRILSFFLKELEFLQSMEKVCVCFKQARSTCLHFKQPDFRVFFNCPKCLQPFPRNLHVFVWMWGPCNIYLCQSICIPAFRSVNYAFKAQCIQRQGWLKFAQQRGTRFAPGEVFKKKIS